MPRGYSSESSTASAAGIPVFYYLFDILWLDGQDTTQLELLDRRRLLRAAITFEAPLRYAEHRVRDGERFYRQACRSGWEGLIAKRASSPYVHRRSPDWLKLKCVAQQELLRALGARLRRLVRSRSPFARGSPPAAGSHWVEPTLVAEVKFAEWTRAGKLRHPRYLGLRPDKPAREVVRETPGVARRAGA